MSSGGDLLVRCLEARDVDRVFCVPGESYLEVLDGLHDSPIHTVVAPGTSLTDVRQLTPAST